MPNDDPTDMELIQVITATNCPLATTTLVERYTIRVRSMVYPLLLNHADADEVTQIALLQALRALGSYRRQAAFSTWLFRIAVNAAKNHRRQQGRHTARQAPEVDTAAIAAPADESPVAIAEYHDSTDTITQAIALLPFEQRVAITLIAIEGHDYPTAAKIAKCNPATLRWRLHRARQRLRQILTTRGDL